MVTLIPVQRGEVVVIPCMRGHLVAHVLRALETLGKLRIVDTAPCGATIFMGRFEESRTIVSLYKNKSIKLHERKCCVTY